MSQPASCPLCGQPARRLWGGERATYRCAGAGGCGVVWTELPERATGPEERFTRRYYQRHYEPRAEAMVRDFTRHLEWVEEQLDEVGFQRRGRGNHWLDVGCGGGYFARAGLDRGWEVTGIDPSPAAVDRARRTAPQGHFSCSAASQLPRYGDPEEEPMDDGEDEAEQRFGVISFWDSLFVVPDPHREMAALRRRLMPGGVMVIKSMHRPPQFFQTANRLLGWRPETRDDFAGVRHARWHFTPDSAWALLRKHGLEPVAHRFTGEVPYAEEDTGTGLKAWVERGIEGILRNSMGPESFLILARKPAKAAAMPVPLRRAA